MKSISISMIVTPATVRGIYGRVDKGLEAQLAGKGKGEELGLDLHTARVRRRLKSLTPPETCSNMITLTEACHGRHRHETPMQRHLHLHLLPESIDIQASCNLFLHAV